MTFVGFVRQALCEDSFYEATILGCGHLAQANDHLGSSQSGGSGRGRGPNSAVFRLMWFWDLGFVPTDDELPCTPNRHRNRS
jgi:hypothetical protein